MLSRRELVRRLAAGAAGVAALSTAGTRVRAAVPPSPTRAGSQTEPGDRAGAKAPENNGAPEPKANQPVAAMQPPWELLRPLAVGTVVADGWRVADLTAPAGGACVLTLRNERDRLQRVHLCRNDGQPEGLVYTHLLDLVVMNGGRGDLDTDEGLAKAVAEISHVLAARESCGQHAEVIASLLPHRERLRQFASESEWTLR